MNWLHQWSHALHFLDRFMRSNINCDGDFPPGPSYCACNGSPGTKASSQLALFFPEVHRTAINHSNCVLKSNLHTFTIGAYWTRHEEKTVTCPSLKFYDKQRGKCVILTPLTSRVLLSSHVHFVYRSDGRWCYRVCAFLFFCLLPQLEMKRENRHC